MRSSIWGASLFVLGSVIGLGLSPTTTSAATVADHAPQGAKSSHHRSVGATVFGSHTIASSARGAPGALAASGTRGWRGSIRYAMYRGYGRRHGRYGGLQCVTYARSASGIDLRGNAANWWENAQGTYARGDAPEPGSVLNFRSNGHMRYGHVAVVSSVVNARMIEIDHANWATGRGSVSRGISVVDVSPNNDWTAVRVGLGHTGDFGSVYPTYGFIYPRPAGEETVRPVARAAVPPIPALNPPPRDFRQGGAEQDVPTFTAASSPSAPVSGHGLNLDVGDGWTDHTVYNAKW